MSSNVSDNVQPTRSRIAGMPRPVFWIVLVVVVAAIAGGAYYYITTQQNSAAAAASAARPADCHGPHRATLPAAPAEPARSAQSSKAAWGSRPAAS